MHKALARAFAQLFLAPIRGVLVLCLIASVTLLVILCALIWVLLYALPFHLVWLHWTVEVLGGFAVVGLAWVLFPGIAGLVVSLFLDRVAGAVEARYYPGLATPRRQGFGELLLGGLRFAGISILLNLLALPIYLFVPALNLLVFLLLNGYLLSREYFELVALRRAGPVDATRLRKAHPAQMMLMGMVFAFLLTVPIVNLIAPVFATAAMVHLFRELSS
jgi:uncharacterized protein involved in cysteine biosynthesis